ncbi:succinate dehydrogenase, cytochrome b556 subunit [Solimonas sp. K1W22B-7]|uniref:succinate dehydrogenase, cytochrome b556 subunit n=1 Tax=Solimonas sp. K1W22B-7 TaxID=2303331 RepID=UPI001F09AD26|nr:succinate dehydrogenase, cytochrome b556 subunit [Solimonas sp. K1W22B-7]
MKTPADNRPLSPFMLGQYYRFQWTSLLSIIHRVTGVGLSVGTLLVAAWLIALAMGPETYRQFAVHLTAWYGQVLLFGWSWALMYHLGNGIRHLFWDIGWGFDLKTAARSGYAVVAASLLLTVAAWAVAYFL